MASIAINVCDTKDNDRFKYTVACLISLTETVDLNKHTVHIVNQNSYKDCTDYLIEECKAKGFILYNLPENIGTANGANLVISKRLPNEVIIKADNDVVWHKVGWADDLESTINSHPEIGILGLKRDDVYGEFTEVGDLLYCDDIMGTCTAFNPALLDKVGVMVQPSNYGFDDVLMSVRSIAAGFKNAFLHKIKITHLDDGKNPYCDWKKREAGVYLQEVSHLCEIIRSRQLSYYYESND